MAVRDWFKKKDKPAPTLDAGIGTKDKYQGPVQQGTSETVFRTTGTSTSPGSTNVTSTSSTPSGVGSSSSSNRGGSSSNRNSSPSNTQSTQTSSLSSPTEAAKALDKPTNVRVNRDGGVTVNNRTYSGNAYIRELNLTANQYKNIVRKNLNQQGYNVGQGRYSTNVQVGTEEISPGERVVYDKLGNVVAVQSEFFGKSFTSADDYNAQIDKYNSSSNVKTTYQGTQSSLDNQTKVINKVTKDKKGNRYEYYSDGTFIVQDKKGNVWSGEYDLKTGQILYSGGVNPVTPEDVFVVASGGVGAIKLPIKKAVTFAFSNVITKPANVLYDKTYQPTTNVGKFTKAAITGVLITRSPTLGEAYLADLTKALITKPVQLGKSIVENPAETLGFAVGTGLLQRGLNLAELQFRGVKVEKVNLPGYGEVFIQKIPKYKDIVWVKGANAATEKLNIMEQVNRLKGRQERVFVQVSPKGVPLKVFSNSKNMGFEVVQVSNPMRGLYQAPPFKFLETYKDILNTNYGAASHYAGGSRRTILPNPIDVLLSKVTDTFSTQRPFQYIERTYKGVETPRWIDEVASAMQKGDKIPKEHISKVNELYRIFLDKPVEFQGKSYKGKEKEKLLNYLNLRGRGSGDKLKVYSALLEYQTKNKVSLVSGAENLAGVLPFGPESQVVRALGTRFYSKSIKDLRKGVKPSVGRNIVELITGTKYGQKTAMIEGQMVEIQPVRSFEGRIKVKSKPSKFVPEKANVSDKLIENILGERRERINRPVPRPLVQRVPRRNERGNDRINNLLRPEPREPRRDIPRVVPRTPRVNVRPRRVQPRVPNLIINPRPPRRNERPPRRPKKPTETPRPFKTTPEQRKRLIKQREKRMKEGYLTLPTVFDELVGKKGRTTTKRISGFETSRIT